MQGVAKPIRHRRTGKESRKLTAWASAVASFGELPQGKRGTLYVTEWKVRRLDESPFVE